MQGFAKIDKLSLHFALLLVENVRVVCHLVSPGVVSLPAEPSDERGTARPFRAEPVFGFGLHSDLKLSSQ